MLQTIRSSLQADKVDLFATNRYRLSHNGPNGDLRKDQAAANSVAVSEPEIIGGLLVTSTKDQALHVLSANRHCVGGKLRLEMERCIEYGAKGETGHEPDALMAQIHRITPYRSALSANSLRPGQNQQQRPGVAVAQDQLALAIKMHAVKDLQHPG